MPEPFERGSVEWDMFTIYFNLCKKYWKPQDNDEYWDGLIADFNMLYDPKFQPFGRELARIFVTYIEKKFKEEKENAETE